VNQFDINFDKPGAICQTPTNAAGVRCLRILVSGGGSTRMCEPGERVITPPSPRACP
jgi:hypothetical protein